MGVDIIKILKKRYFLILIFIAMITSMSFVSANGMPDFGLEVQRSVYDSEVVTTKKSTYVIVNLNEQITFEANTKNVEKINWNFGDKTEILKKKTMKNRSIVTHTFKKVGTYYVKVDIEGQVDKINYVNTTDFVMVKVVKKPDLVLTKLIYAPKGKDIIGFQATVKNKGSAASKASNIKMWYENKKLNKFTKSAKIPALKPGKSTVATIKFQVPYKFRNYVKNVKVDSNNKISESIESNNLKQFKNFSSSV